MEVCCSPSAWQPGTVWGGKGAPFPRGPSPHPVLPSPLRPCPALPSSFLFAPLPSLLSPAIVTLLCPALIALPCPALQVLKDSSQLTGSLGTPAPRPILFILKNLGMAAITLPNHYLLLHYLWTHAVGGREVLGTCVNMWWGEGGCCVLADVCSGGEGERGKGEVTCYCPLSGHATALWLLWGSASAISDTLAWSGPWSLLPPTPPHPAPPHHSDLTVSLLPAAAMQARRGVSVLLLTPLNLLPLVLANVTAVQYLAALAMLAALLQYFSMKHVRQVGMKAI